MAQTQPTARSQVNPPRPLASVMSRPLVALLAYDTAAEALATAREHHVHHFPVYSGDHLMGMVCTCDLQEARVDQPVAEVMRPAVTIAATRSAAEAGMLMKAAEVGSVLVLDLSGRACGIVTRGDLDHAGSAAEAILADQRCECCGTAHHLHQYDGRRLCFSCRERATEPQAFETGGGD